MIKNIIIIAIILGAVVASQQPQVKSWGQNTYSWIEKTADPYTSKVTDLFEKKVYPIVGGEVEKRKDIIEQGIAEEKEKISETLAEKIKNYFSNVIGSIFFPGKSNSNQINNSNLPNTSPEIQKCIDTCRGN